MSLSLVTNLKVLPFDLSMCKWIGGPHLHWRMETPLVLNIYKTKIVSSLDIHVRSCHDKYILVPEFVDEQS